MAAPEKRIPQQPGTSDDRSEAILDAFRMLDIETAEKRARFTQWAKPSGLDPWQHRKDGQETRYMVGDTGAELE